MAKSNARYLSVQAIIIAWGPQGSQVPRWSRCPVAAVGVLVSLGADKCSREWPERTLYDMSARLRLGRYQVKSGRSEKHPFP